MSDQSQGPGWWQASDGKWYPPEQAPPGYAAPTTGIPQVPPTQPLGPPLGQPVPPFGSPAPSGPSGPPAAPAKSGLGRGPIIGIVAAVVVVLAAVLFFATKGDDNKKNASATESSSSSSSSSSSRSSSSRSSSSSSNTAEAPPGFKTLSNKSDGVSIAVPDDFVEFDVSGTSANASDLASDNPDLAPFLGSAAAFAGNTSIAARAPGSSPTAVIVGQSPQQFDVEDPTVAQGLKQVFANVGPIVDAQTENVTLPAGPALRLAVELKIDTPNSSTASVHETIYFVNAGGATWVVLGVSTGATDESALFDQIAQTFTVN